MLPLRGSLVDVTPSERGSADAEEIASVQRVLAGATAPPSPLSASEIADAARRRQLYAEDSAIDAGIMNVRIDAFMRGTMWSAIVQLAHYGIRAWWDARAARTPSQPPVLPVTLAAQATVPPQQKGSAQ
ncbi:MAG TPA: hypothetical protein VMJ10_30095 [Kofleriaceae bacterium]|nr:hypothetical protein [Kofleriaceae bacterium]